MTITHLIFMYGMRVTRPLLTSQMVVSPVRFPVERCVSFTNGSTYIKKS